MKPGVRFYRSESVSIGRGTTVYAHTLVEVVSSGAGPKIMIGKNCHIGEYSHISALNGIRIGDNLMTGRFVLITDNVHGTTDGAERDIPPEHRNVISKGPVIIGDNVWLADKVSVMPGVRIGDGAIIAANSVVTHDIPPYALAAGSPARVIRIMHG